MHLPQCQWQCMARWGTGPLWSFFRSLWLPSFTLGSQGCRCKYVACLLKVLWCSLQDLVGIMCPRQSAMGSTEQLDPACYACIILVTCAIEI